MRNDIPEEYILLNEVRKLFTHRFVSKENPLHKNFKIVDSRDVYDIKLMYKRHVLAFIDVKKDITYLKAATLTSMLLDSQENFFGAQYVIFTDSREFLLWSDSGEKKRLESIDEVYRVIVDDRSRYSSKEKESILEVVYTYMKEEHPLILDICRVKTQHDLDSKISYDAIVRYASFSEDYEREVFNSIIEDVPKGELVYRYTSLSSIVKTISSGNYRLNCIVAMNDKSEVNYVENYMSDKDDCEEIDESIIKFANNRFISSLTERGDDLTLWRMYTENASGVCLVFKALSNMKESGLMLKRVSYAEKGRNHPKLDMLERLIKILQEELNVTFKYSYLYLWKHFFKPYEYKDEREVRLLYYSKDPQRKWDINSSNGILSPYVEFPLFKHLPIELCRIIIGPRTSEKDLNKVQLQTTCKDAALNFQERKFSSVSVSTSQIRSYR